MSAEDFCEAIIVLKNQMRDQIPEFELVRIVKDNLKEGLSQLLFPININSMDRLVDECWRAKKNVAKRQKKIEHFRNMPPRRVHELDVADEQDRFI